MFNINCHDEFYSLSNFAITFFIIIILLIDANKNTGFTLVDFLFISSFILSVISAFAVIKKLKSGNKRKFTNNTSITDWTGNRKVFEIWFMTMSPLLAISTKTTSEKWLLLVLFFLILRIISSQRLFVYNILYTLIGYNFFELTIGNEVVTCITAYNKVQLNSEIHRYCEYVDLGEQVIYVSKKKR